MQPLQTVAGIVNLTFLVVLCIFEVACIRKYLAAWISNSTSILLLYMAMYWDTYKGIFCWWLDLDFRAYPYVPSSSTVSKVYALVLEFLPRRSDSPSASWRQKAYATRVGGGPFPSEQLNVSIFLQKCFLLSFFLIHSNVLMFRLLVCISKRSRIWYYHWSF